MLGVDISGAAIKAVEISGKGHDRCIEAFGMEFLPQGALEGNTIKDPVLVANALRQLLMKSGFKSKLAALAVPDSAVITKILQVNDDLAENEIEEFIIMEADKYIPFPVEEISIDFSVIGHSQKNPSVVDVLLVASHAANVNSRVGAATKAGLQVRIVDVESFVIERAIGLLSKDLPAEGLDKVIAVLDVREESTSLFVLQNMKMIYTREDEFSARQLTNEAMRHYEVTQEQAKAMRDADVKRPDDYYEVVLKPFMDSLLLHVKRSLQFFFSTSHSEYVDHILIAGSISKLPNMVDLIQNETHIPVSIANPARHLKISDRLSVADVLDEAPSFLTAIGLAMRLADAL